MENSSAPTIHERIALVAALLLCAVWGFILHDQFPLSKDVECWFFDPSRQELSVSELVSFAAWVTASGLAAYKAREDRRWWWLAAGFALMAAEEGNYGVPIYSAFTGQYRSGRSLHNVWESENEPAYWLAELVAKDIVLGTVYLALPAIVAYRTRSARKTLPYALPAFLLLLTAFRVTAWEQRFHESAFMNHPCIDLADELHETLSALSAALWMTLALGGAGRRGYGASVSAKNSANRSET